MPLGGQEVKEMVFMAIGFETTSPTTAAMMVEDFPITSLFCRATVFPALEAIIKMGEFRIDGLIEPGHVSVMIGRSPIIFSERDKIPQVIVVLNLSTSLWHHICGFGKSRKAGRRSRMNIVAW